MKSSLLLDDTRNLLTIYHEKNMCIYTCTTKLKMYLRERQGASLRLRNKNSKFRTLNNHQPSNFHKDNVGFHTFILAVWNAIKKQIKYNVPIKLWYIEKEANYAKVQSNLWSNQET